MHSSKDKKNQRCKQKINRNYRTNHNGSISRSEPVNEANELHPMHALLAKDSEWVDVLHTTKAAAAASAERASSSNNPSDDRIIALEEALGETTPFAAMFPGLVQRDPQALEGIATRTMSTTEITRRLVNLHERADLTAKRMERLIPKNKQWLEPLIENSLMENATVSTNTNESMITDTASNQSNSSEEQYHNEMFFFGHSQYKRK